MQEILEERVVSSRGKANYRTVKMHRKKYDRKIRGAKPPPYNPKIVLLM